MKEFFNLLKANGMIMNLVFFMAVAFMLGAAGNCKMTKQKDCQRSAVFLF